MPGSAITMLDKRRSLPESSSHKRESRPWPARVALLVLLATHGFAIGHYIIGPGQLISGDVPLTYDYSLHFQQVYASVSFLAHGRWFGYDPYFMGGYLNTNLFNAEAKGWALFVFILQRFTGFAAAFKLFIPVLLLWIPVWPYAAARMLGFRRGASLAGSALAAALFWCAEPLKLVQWGLISFVAVAAATPLLTVCLNRLLSRFSWFMMTVVSVALACCFLVHILTPVLLLPGVMAFFTVKSAWRGRRLLTLAGICVIVALLNVGWIVPFCQTLGELTSSAHEFTLQNHDPWLPLHYFAALPKVWLLALYVLGIAGACRRLSRGDRQRALLALMPTACFWLLASYGSWWALTARLQPLRFLIPAHWSLLPLILWGFEALCERISEKRRSLVAVAAVALPALNVFIGFGAALSEAGRQPANHRATVISTDLPPELQQLLAWIRENTDRSARILIEDSGTLSGHRYYGSYFPGLLPFLTDRQLLGGPWPYMFVEAHITDFHEGLLFGQPVSSYSEDQFRLMATYYNLGWVVCWSPQSRAFFSSLPGSVIPAGEAGTFSTYLIARAHSFMLNGSGEVAAHFDRIEVRSAIARDGYVSLAYHFDPNLRCEPRGTTEPYSIPGIPRPFIKVSGAPAEFKLQCEPPAWWRVRRSAGL